MSAQENDLRLLTSKVNRLPLGGQRIEVDSLLAGGVVSVVGAGTLFKGDGSEGTRIAIKHTKQNPPLGPKFSDVERDNLLKYAARSQGLDAEILKRLQDNENVLVPTLLAHFDGPRVTILEHFGPSGYELMQDVLIRQGEIPPSAWTNVGRSIAHLRTAMGEMNGVAGVEKPKLQARERFDELRGTLYDGRMHYYNELMGTFLDPSRATLTWTDGHPKNMAVDTSGQVMFFDFGRSIACDPEYPVPNFLGQIFLFALAGSMPTKGLFANARKLIDAYENVTSDQLKQPYKLDQTKLVRYLVGELAHRGMTMRWLDPKMVKIPAHRVQGAVSHLVDLVFDKNEPITTMDGLQEVYMQIAGHLHDKDDAYLRPSVSSRAE